MKSVSTSSNVATLAAAVLNTAPETGGVAVLDQPNVAAPKAPKARTPRKAPVKAPQAITPPATIDPAVEQALEMAVGTTAALNAAAGKNLRSSEISKQDRRVAHVAAVEILLAIGLGDRSKGHGPVLRSAIVRMVKEAGNLKTVPISALNQAALRGILSDPGFKAKALAAIDANLADTAARSAKILERSGRAISATTVKTRDANTVKARLWINSGLATSYLNGLDVIAQMGGRVDITGISLPVDRLLAVAFGRTISASELFKGASTAKVTKA